MNTTDYGFLLDNLTNENNSALTTIELDKGATGAAIFLAVLFLIIFCIMFFSVITYIVINLVQGNEPLLVHWWDFCTNQGFIIIYIILYLLYLLDLYKNANDNDGYVPKCKESKLCINLNFLFYVLICIILSNNLFNCIQSIQLFMTINKVVSIKAENMKMLTSELNKIGVTKTTKNVRHYIELGIELSLHVFLFAFMHLRYGTPKEHKIVVALDNFLLPLYITYLIIELFVVYLLKFYKTKLMENNFYNNNLTMQAYYNISSSKVVFFTDFINYKSILDFCSCFPSMVFYIQGDITFSALFLTFSVYAIHGFFTASIYLYVDKTNKIPVQWWLKKLFLVNVFKLNFGEKEKAKLFDEYLLDINTEDQNEAIMGDLNSSTFNLDPIMELQSRSQSFLMN